MDGYSKIEIVWHAADQTTIYFFNALVPSVEGLLHEEEKVN
jgi:hypothetical protein